MRSVFNDEKKLSIAALSQTPPERLIEQVTPRSVNNLRRNVGCQQVAADRPSDQFVTAIKPAAMRRWMTFPMTICAAIFKALAPASADRVAAGQHCLPGPRP